MARLALRGLSWATGGVVHCAVPCEVHRMIFSDDTRYLIDTVCSYEPDLPNGFYSVSKLQTKMNRVDATMILESLGNRGYVHWGDKYHSAFWLLEEARAYKNIEKLENRERWKERLIGFAFGIVTGVATGTLVAVLSGLIG